jgi:hypothetical protein
MKFLGTAQVCKGGGGRFAQNKKPEHQSLANNTLDQCTNR